MLAGTSSVAFSIRQASLVGANSRKVSDGFSPQQSGRDGMLRLTAQSASLQDTDVVSCLRTAHTVAYHGAFRS